MKGGKRRRVANRCPSKHRVLNVGCQNGGGPVSSDPTYPSQARGNLPGWASLYILICPARGTGLAAPQPDTEQEGAGS